MRMRILRTTAVARATAATRSRGTAPAAAVLAMLVLLVDVTAALAAACAPYAADERAIAAARIAVASECDCAAAASRTEWYGCVRGVLAGLRDAGELTPSCMAHALGVEMSSTCGRPGAVVCCRTFQSESSSHVASLVRPSGTCAGAGADFSCESPLARVAEACNLFGCAQVPGEIVVAERCGNGRREPGEDCDPPDGTACSAWCQRCTTNGDEIALGCSDAYANVAAAAVPGTFLVTFGTSTRNGERALATRLDPSGRVLDEALPVASDARTRRPPVYTKADSATADGSGFYVAWYGAGGWQGRRVPVSGPIASKVDTLTEGTFEGIGMCRTQSVPPLELAPTLDGSGIHFTQTISYGSFCGGPSVLEGVPFEFDPFPFPIVASGSPGRLARGAHDVAAAWLVIRLDEITPPTPPTPAVTLYGGWIEPEPGAFPLAAVVDDFASPGLAAVGDTFLVAYADAGVLRAIRFSRAAGVVDSAPGLLISDDVQSVEEVRATSDGERFVVVWREARPDGNHLRMVRLAPDGSVLDAAPREVATIDTNAPFAVAAQPSSVLAAYVRRETSGAIAVRAIVVPN